MKFAGILSVVLYFINYEYFYQKSIIGEIIHYVLLLPIILGFLSMEVSGRNWLVAVGNCSYGIYLSHSTMLNVLFHMLERWGFTYSVWIHAIVLAITLGVGLIFGSVDQELGKVWKKMILIPKMGVQRFIYVTVSFLAASAVIMGSLKISASRWPAAMVDFDMTAILQNEEIVAGWVDNWSVQEKQGKLEIFVEGWAYDPIHTVTVEQIIVEVGNQKAAIGHTQWFDRPAVADILGNSAITKCGFQMTIHGLPKDLIGNDAAVYAVLSDNTYMQLKSVEKLTVRAG